MDMKTSKLSTNRQEYLKTSPGEVSLSRKNKAGGKGADKSRRSPLPHAPYQDYFKFRLECRREGHLFRNVRFDLPGLETGERQAVVDFFEGRMLEELRNPDGVLGRVFPKTSAAYLPALNEMISELQHLFCS